MSRIPHVITLGALLALTACSGGNPFDPAGEDAVDTDTGGDTDEDTGGGITGDRGLPPGTARPTPDSAIVRYEAENGDTGGGFARNISYDRQSDTFSVDNLAFDGDNTYARGGQPGSQNRVGQIGPFAVYEGDRTATDLVTGNPVGTLAYRAIYGVSRSGQTEFAIVRTGSYLDYGFGGFVYQRNDTDAAGNPATLELPTQGDAAYAGDYAGVRIFQGRTGLDYVTGDAAMTVDFKDFDDSRSGVMMTVRNRRLYDIDGTDITAAYTGALRDGNEGVVLPRDASGAAILPDINSTVAPDVADRNGELRQDVFTTLAFEDGTTQQRATGQYYAIMAGENASEIVGVLVMEGDDARGGATFQETGGFIVYRQ